MESNTEPTQLDSDLSDAIDEMRAGNVSPLNLSEPANVDPKALLAQGQAALKASDARIAAAEKELHAAKESRDAAMKLVRAFTPRKARQSTKKAAAAK